MKKPKIKINFKYFWPNFDPKNNYFTDLLRKNYTVEIKKDPNIMFYSVFQQGNTTNPTNWENPLLKPIRKMSTFFEDTFPNFHNALKKAIYTKPQFKMNELEGNFVKVFYTEENVKPVMNKCDWAFSFEYDDEFNHPKHMRLPYYAFESPNFGKELIKHKKPIIKDKKFCSFIYSAKNYFREDFFRKLSKYKHVDAPGKRMNNMPPIGSNTPQKSRNEKDWINQKVNFLKNYKFTVAFENESYPGYTTEKIYTAMLAGSIPLYFGNPLIHRDFNTKSFLNLNDFKNMKDFVETIKQVDTDKKMYKQYIEEPWFNDNTPSIFFDKQIMLNRLDEIIKST